MWSRLYREAAGTTGDGQIDTTWVSPPDQYIDGFEATSYQLQISNTLTSSDWADTGAVMAGTGGELTVEVAAATAQPLFYRVVVLDTGG